MKKNNHEKTRTTFFYIDCLLRKCTTTVGYIVQPEDHKTMAARLISLLREPEKARLMGEEGRRRVQAQFSCEAQLKKVEDLYARLLLKARK